MINYKAGNIFVVQGNLVDSNGVTITIPAPADTLLNNINTVGLGQLHLWVAGSSPLTYATTNDGASTFSLNGVNCYALTTNGNTMYFTVRGGLAAGSYEGLLVYKIKNGSGQFDERLSTETIAFNVEAQDIDITL